MAYFAWNMTDDEDEFRMLADTIMETGELHQGWGLAGMDMTFPFSDYEKAWLNAGWGDGAEKKYNQLKRLLSISENDIIMVKSFVDGNRDRIPCGFTICECTAPYAFKPVGARQDYGHYIKVKTIAGYTQFGADTKLGRKLLGLQEAVQPIVSEDIISAIITLKDNAEVAKNVLSWASL